MKFRNLNSIHLRGVFWLGLLLLGFSASIAPVCFAQGEASIQGTISDSTGGAIGSAAVQIKNLETGTERNLITDEAGRYDAASLPVGH
ncbi:MAG: carboxypeptidase-like regulatory domain-containing protein, partial [Candidatus Acidiferrales bacterium]